MPVRKRFGQHFLHDPGVIRRIIDRSRPIAGKRIVEVGPGRGALTWGLLERAKRLDVIEIDRDLAASLKADPRAVNGLNVHVENVLDTDFIRLRGSGGPLRIVGNLPYNISTPLLFRLLAQRAADLRHVLHAAEGSRGSNDRAAWKQGLRAIDRHAGGGCGGRRSVRRRPRRISAAAQGVVRNRALAAHRRAPLRHRPRRRTANLGDDRVLAPAQDAAQFPQRTARRAARSNAAVSIRNCVPKRSRRRNSGCWPPITLDWSAILEPAWPDTRSSWCCRICRKAASRSPLPDGNSRRTPMPPWWSCMSWNSCRSSPWANR